MGVEADDAAGLTMAIRQLSETDVANQDVFEEKVGKALLLCRDKDARKWGTRWLGRCRMQVTAATDLDNGLDVARTTQPDVIVVEASISDNTGRPLFEVLEEAGDVAASVIVLCSNNSQAQAALAMEVFDIARKPFNWQSIATRAQHAMQIRNRDDSLEEANEALQEALQVANSARKQLRSSERFEPVTGLPNKSKFTDLVSRAMMAANRDGGDLAVFVIGFNRFRLVVEAMGQQQADNVLAEIGSRLAEAVTASNTIPDEAPQGLRTAIIGTLDSYQFGLMITAHGDEHLQRFQQHLLDVLSQPIQVMGQIVHLSACLGIAAYPQDAEDVDTLLQRADNAMRDAQSRGGGFRFYCSETDRAAARKLRIENMLHEAIDRNELSIVYQPIVDFGTGRVNALEALLRWQQADGTFIPPDQFIPVAEESRLMLRIGEFVLAGACQQLADWGHLQDGPSIICVNVSRVQLMSRDFTHTVQKAIQSSGIDPQQLELEISERGVLSGNTQVVDQLRQLKALGVRLSIDDFGTGDSAIAYLKELPVDTLKIDRSYIAGFGDGGKDFAIVSAMIALGQGLNLEVIAEGVEEPEQLEALREIGCDSYQGYYASRPLDVTALEQFLEAKPRLI